MGRSAAARRPDTRYLLYSPFGDHRPYPSQWRFHQLNTRYRGYSGPIGTGKSIAAANEVIRLCYINAGLPGMLTAPTYRLLFDTTKRALLELLDLNSIPYHERKGSDMIVLDEPGSEVWLRSMDAEDRLRGPNLAWTVSDELTYCKKEAFDILRGRVRHPAATALVHAGFWTPNGFDWVYDEFINPAKRQPDHSFVLAKPGENKTILERDPHFYDRLKFAYDDRFYRQEALGEYLPVFGGMCYHAFDRTKDVDSKLTYDPAFPLVWSLDFNVNPMSSVIGQIVETREFIEVLRGRRRRYYQVLDELSLPNSNTMAACRELEKRVTAMTGGRPVDLMVYGDTTSNVRRTNGANDWDLIQDYFRAHRSIRLQMRLPSGNPAVRERVTAVNAAFCDAGFERSVKVHPRCVELITDLEQNAWAEDSHGNTLDDMDKTNPKRTHMGDALGYWIWFESPLRVKGGFRSNVIA